MLQGVIKVIINKNIYIISYLNVGVLTHCARDTRLQGVRRGTRGREGTRGRMRQKG
mgnify:CR=1 FL=1